MLAAEPNCFKFFNPPRVCSLGDNLAGFALVAGLFKLNKVGFLTKP